MNDDRGIIFWREKDDFVATLSTPLTESIQLGGKTLKMMGSLGDYDLLRSDMDELVGVAFSVTQLDLKLIEPLVSESSRVAINLPDVRFYFSPCVSPKIQTVQGSSWIYGDHARPVAIGIHRWIDWGLIGFKPVVE